MTSQTNTNQSSQLLQRLARTGKAAGDENFFVTAPGDRTLTFPAIVTSHHSYNFYNVRIVELGGPGSLPSPFGGTVQAVNLAESFLLQGTLPANAYVLVSRAGSQYAFYAKP